MPVRLIFSTGLSGTRLGSFGWSRPGCGCWTASHPTTPKQTHPALNQSNRPTVGDAWVAAGPTNAQKCRFLLVFPPSSGPAGGGSGEVPLQRLSRLSQPVLLPRHLPVPGPGGQAGVRVSAGKKRKRKKKPNKNLGQFKSKRVLHLSWGNPPKKWGRPWFCRAPSGCPGPGADADALPVCVCPPHRCRCHSGYVGTRCEHADLLAVVAANQKKQTITALVVVSVVASVLLIGVCVLIQ